MTDELLDRSAYELASRIRRGLLSPVDVVDACFERIERRDGELNAFVTLTEEAAREDARAAEREVERGAVRGPLHGLPVAVKDITDVAGVRTTYGAKPFAENVAEADDPVVARLRAAGAIVVGKTNTPEFAFSGVTKNELFGSTGNPFDPARTPGGSSGGSAAAVGAGMVPFAHATDGGGSIRIPAAFCGIYGIKPTFGRVPMASRPDAFNRHTPTIGVGPLARTVEDAALLLDAMVGPHPRDPFSLPDDGTDYLGAVRRPVDDLRVAYSPDLDVFPVHPEVRRLVDAAVDDLAEAGAGVDRIELGIEDRETLHETWLVGMTSKGAELATLFEERAGVDVRGADREAITPGLVEDRIEPGFGHDAVEYLRANVPRTELFDAVEDVFEEYDLLATPTLTVPAFDREGPAPSTVDGRSIDPAYDWRPTHLFNLTGHPAASVPAGVTDDGLPVGLQLAGPRFGEDVVLAASAAVERVRPWHDSYPAP